MNQKEISSTWKQERDSDEHKTTKGDWKLTDRLQSLGLGDKTVGQTMKERIEHEFLVECRDFEDIVEYHSHPIFNWEKFTSEGEF